MFLKQSTAVTVVLGPFVDSADGATAETALTIAQADVRLSKNGGAFAQKGDATSCTHMENGHYSCLLSTADTGTLGHLRAAVNESGALAVWRDFLVLPANVYDSLVGGSDALQVHANEMTAGLITSASFAAGAINAAAVADGAITAAKVATGAIDADALAADAVDEILDEVVEGSITLRQALRLFLAVLAGKSAGGGTTTVTFRDLADTKNRISATVDANGNRMAVTRDVS